MDAHQDPQLPGSRSCVGCHGTTFRQRDDGLCPRCAFDAECLIERIEVDGLHRDLQLMTEFDAYYRQREEQRERASNVSSGNVFARDRQESTLSRRPWPALQQDPFWASFREAS